jgi:hypothetical protein
LSSYATFQLQIAGFKLKRSGPAILILSVNCPRGRWQVPNPIRQFARAFSDNFNGR